MVPFSETKAYQQCVDYAKRHDMNVSMLTERARRRTLVHRGVEFGHRMTIGGAFSWAESPEGPLFWANVNNGA